MGINNWFFINWDSFNDLVGLHIWLESGSLELAGSLYNTLRPLIFRCEVRWIHDVLAVVLELTLRALIKLSLVECAFSKVFHWDSCFIIGCDLIANQYLVKVMNTLNDLWRIFEAITCDFNICYWFCNKRCLIHLPWDILVKWSVPFQVSAILMINYNWRHNRALRIGCIIYHTFMSCFLR
jgi:hypothetical protein